MKDLFVLFGLIILIVIAHSWKNPERKDVLKSDKELSVNHENRGIQGAGSEQNFAQQAVFPLNSIRQKSLVLEAVPQRSESYNRKTCPLYFPVKYHFCPAAHSSVSRFESIAGR